eukprot:TRINITY_DN88681_c0_g1_i1.p1 TRINITY_DN88681_c0_g1~~TRINITY_DN88681_c0_g1_i1.p1  ORF type:complete len:119 (-),score=32.04 TRINITY_DN88681_c0_g1_i1:83-439(-)
MAAAAPNVSCMLPQDSIHLRIKRRQSTVFVLCYPEQHVISVKEKIATIFKRDISTFRLLYKDMILDEEASIRSQQIASNDIVHLVFKDDRSDGYEKVEFEDLDKLHLEWEAKNKAASS